MYHVRIFIIEKMGFEMALRLCGIHSKPQSLLQKTYLSYAFEALATYARMCLRTYALACIRKPRLTYTCQGPLWSFNFSKNRFFSHLKCYIFHVNTPQVNLISDWALNWPCVFEFEHHWGMGAQDVRGTKCGVYTYAENALFLELFLSKLYVFNLIFNYHFKTHKTQQKNKNLARVDDSKNYGPNS